MSISVVMAAALLFASNDVYDTVDAVAGAASSPTEQNPIPSAPTSSPLAVENLQAAPVEGDDLIIIVDDDADDFIILNDSEDGLPTRVPSESAWDAGRTWVGMGVGSRLYIDTHFDGANEDVVEWWNDLRLSIDHRQDKHLRVYMESLVRFSGVAEEPRDGQRFWLVNGADPKWWAEASLREAYIDYAWGNFQVRGGQQIFAWGKNEFFAPADVLNPIDFRGDLVGRFLNPKDAKVPVLALNAAYVSDDLAVEMVWLPMFHGNKALLFGRDFALGPPGSRLDQQARTLLRVHPSIEDDLQSAVSGTQTPYPVVEASSLALRATGRLFGWDLGATAYYGWERTPTVWLDSDVQTLVENAQAVQAEPQLLVEDERLRQAAANVQQKYIVGEELFYARFQRMWMFALEAQGVIGDVVVRADAGFSPGRVFYTEDFRYHTLSTANGIAGVEYNYGERWYAALSGHAVAVFNAPRDGRVVGLEAVNVSPGERRHAVLYGLSAVTRLSIPEIDVNMQATGLYNIAPGDWAATGEVVFNRWQPHEVGLGALMIGGAPGTAGNNFKRNDFVYLRYAAKW